ncbi:hypothetical protein Q5P01_018992 [Channa striata]|uniref:G-protein coupled receptors family 1 profile domain-containing protein n=1 Tax=Channa striata TaxID=64152 RepID=A0AA88M372_CHASR|nr:hypothetical protein Q5P01_018992 [Channa striata]
MSHAAQSLDNLTAPGLLERITLSSLTTAPCCIFIFINGTMLFALRNKLVLRETSRYILLFNLLFADTVQMAVSQLLYLLASCRIMLTYPVCGVLVMLANLTNEISPLTLVAMSLERFVAVCYPLRHPSIITMRNTQLAIVVVWAFCSFNVLIRVVLFLEYQLANLPSLQMKDLCSTLGMFLGPVSSDYDKAYTAFVFLSAGVAVIFSHIGVTVAARSASTNKASARKARNTLLLHVMQLGLSLSSTVHNAVLVAISKVFTRTVLVRIQCVLYVFLIMLPRCLSALIYGLRDQTIRSILVYHLCCRLKISAVAAKAETSL